MTPTTALPSPTELALDWMLPGARNAPADSMHRIRPCAPPTPTCSRPLITVLATHQGVPRELLAVAIKQCRPDLESFSRGDVSQLLIAAWNGGKSGMDAVHRARSSKGKRSSASLSWVRGRAAQSKSAQCGQPARPSFSSRRDIGLTTRPMRFGVQGHGFSTAVMGSVRQPPCCLSSRSRCSVG